MTRGVTRREKMRETAEAWKQCREAMDAEIQCLRDDAAELLRGGKTGEAISLARLAEAKTEAKERVGETWKGWLDVKEGADPPPPERRRPRYSHEAAGIREGDVLTLRDHQDLRGKAWGRNKIMVEGQIQPESLSAAGKRLRARIGTGERGRPGSWMFQGRSLSEWRERVEAGGAGPVRDAEKGENPELDLE